MHENLSLHRSILKYEIITMPSTTYSIATKYNLSKSCFFIFTVQNNVQRQSSELLSE